MKSNFTHTFIDFCERGKTNHFCVRPITRVFLQRLLAVQTTSYIVHGDNVIDNYITIVPKNLFTQEVIFSHAYVRRISKYVGSYRNCSVLIKYPNVSGTAEDR